jgi:glycerol uptake facilitator-like aquaporin
MLLRLPLLVPLVHLLRVKRETALGWSGEFLGTALLLAGIVGSGIMAENLSGGNRALALLANALATGALLPVLIVLFAPLSGAHFNPVVSFVEMLDGRLSWIRFLIHATAQVLGGLAGMFTAHAMFGLRILQVSGHARTGLAQGLSEGIATFGLVLLILRRFSLPKDQVPWLIGLYIFGAYWFTASTSFANPAVTIARAFTNTFSGIRPLDAPAFILAQILGATAAYLLNRWIRTLEKTHG